MKKLNEVFENMKNNATKEFTPLADGVYTGRLCMARISKQASRFVKDGEQPKDQISFVFDVDGRYVSTKCFGISWTDKSSLPKFFKCAKCKNIGEFDKWLEKQLSKDAGYFNLFITTNEAGYNVLENIMGQPAEVDKKIEGKVLPTFLNKVFGVECEESSISVDYKTN